MIIDVVTIDAMEIERCALKIKINEAVGLRITVRRNFDLWLRFSYLF